MKILHCFADKGAENPCLSRYGDVYRFSIDVTPNEYSEAVQCDARQLPIQDNVTFDLGVFHPPCTKWSTMPGANKDGKAPNLLPLSREIAHKYCTDWIIENRPNAPLKDPVVLDGHMFNLGIEYERGFETSFPVEQPRKQDTLAETSPFFYSNRSREWWASVKGTDTDFAKQHIAKNTIPAAYLDYLLRHYAQARDETDRKEMVNREKYDNYDKEMDTKRAQETNQSLTSFL